MKFKPYPKYKASGVEWLGDVPEHWIMQKMSWHFSGEKGKTGQLLTKEYCSENEGIYPVYSGQTENDGVMGAINAYEYEFENEGVLFSTTVGAKAMHLKHLRGKFSLSQNCMIIRPVTQSLNIRYCYYHFQPLFSFERSQIPDHMQPSFRMEDLNSYAIALPPIQEQRAIAAFLDRETAKIDTLIAKQEKLIDLLKEKRQAVISHAVTKGLDPTVPMKPSGVEWLGDVPIGWKVKKIAHAIESMGSGTTPKSDMSEYYENGEIPWLNTGDLNDAELYSCNKNISRAALEAHSTLKIYPAGSVVIAMYGATIGKLAKLRFSTTVNQACCVFFCGEILHNNFLFYWLLGFREQIVSLATGGGQPNISQEVLRTLRLACPNLSEQTAIATFLDLETTKIDTLIAKAQQAIALQKEHRTALISAAVTGKIDVRNIVCKADDKSSTQKIKKVQHANI